MKYKYDYKIKFGLNQPFDIDRINRVCKRYPNSIILVEIQNTKGISSSMIRKLENNVLIRIAGGYDDKRISRYGKDLHWSSNYYFDSTIYTKRETINMISEMESIESNLKDNWSSIQKLVYIYEKLKSGIMYDPKYEKKDSSEVRSLRGLLTKETVCAGYSLILKEFMDRNNIECEYVEGFVKKDNTGGHAWNIITINGKKYPIDLTWDNSKFRSGDSKTFDWIGKNIKEFSESHHPAPGEKTQDYMHTLTPIDSEIVKKIYYQTGVWKSKGYNTTTYTGTRNDGSKYTVAQIGDAIINGVKYYRYYYVENNQKPLILYSETNITNFINKKRFKKPIHPKQEETINNILFSRENINDSILKGTYYIGKEKKDRSDNKLEFVNSIYEIKKSESKRNIFNYPTKVYTRSDGSSFIAQMMDDNITSINGIKLFKYDIFEMVKTNGKNELRKNIVYTERDFFKDNRQGIANDFLSRSRLDRKFNEAGGYIGYYDANGFRTYNPDLVKYYDTSKYLDIEILEKQKKTNNLIPSFDELKELALKYEIFIDSNDPFDDNISKMKIRNIKTKKIETDRKIIDKAMFANIWLNSAGVKYSYNEERPGELYAFNDSARNLYETICSELIQSCKKDGVIDTLELLKNIENKNTYKHNEKIIVELFRSPFQTQLINGLFLQSLGMIETKTPEPLYSLNYAGNLINNNGKRI